MGWVGFLIAGVMFNLISILIFHKSKIRLRGLDSMPAIPIAAGFVLGMGAGASIGAVLSVSYHTMKPSTLGSLPLTLIGSSIAGLLGALFSSFGLFTAGIFIIFIYHLISLVLTSVVSQPSPGYMMFIGINVVTSIALLIIIGGILGI